MLHFDPEVRNSTLRLAPAVPAWIGRLTVRRVPLMGGHLTIEVDGDQCDVLEQPAGLTILREVRSPTM